MNPRIDRGNHLFCSTRRGARNFWGQVSFLKIRAKNLFFFSDKTTCWHYSGLLSMACILAVIVIIFYKSPSCMHHHGWCWGVGVECILAFLEALKLNFWCSLKANIKENECYVMNLNFRRGRIPGQLYIVDLFSKNEYHIQIQNIL